jgi:inorganic triphosphatase YgiF
MGAARILVRMHAPEIELKFAVADIDRFRARVQALGLTLVTPRTFEANTLYDTPERDAFGARFCGCATTPGARW